MTQESVCQTAAKELGVTVELLSTPELTNFICETMISYFERLNDTLSDDIDEEDIVDSLDRAEVEVDRKKQGAAPKAKSKAKKSDSQADEKVKVQKSKAKEEKNLGAKNDKAASTRMEATITRLKGYIVKCGVRRVWKRELEGMSPKQTIAHLQGILTELGVEGRPTLEKCKQVRDRRELLQELEATIDPSNVIDTRLRRDDPKTKRNVLPPSSPLLASSSNRLDLSRFGDAEDD